MWDPTDEFDKAYRDMDKAFSRNTGLISWDDERKGLTKWKEGFRAPMSTVKQTDKNVIADIELPGANKSEIELNMTEDRIEISSERKQEKETNKRGIYSYERSMSGFYRSIPLPVQVEPGKATATYKNGILHIEVPKSKRMLEKKKKLQIK